MKQFRGKFLQVQFAKHLVSFKTLPENSTESTKISDSQ